MHSKQTYLLHFYKKNNNAISVNTSQKLETIFNSVIESIDDNFELSPKKKKGTFIRNYNDDYIKYGFICYYSGSNPVPKPQCVLCSVILSNEMMKTAKLIRHLETKHKEFINKPVIFFIRKNKKLSAQKKSYV